MDTCTIFGLISILSLIPGAELLIVISPNNTLVLQSGLVLNCTSDITAASGISWNRLNSDGSVAQGLIGCLPFGVVPAPYKFENFSNACNLVVDVVTTAEAGQYECYIAGPPQFKDSAAVVLLSAPPTLIVTGSNTDYTTGENVTLEYTVPYSGDMTPELIWYSSPDIQTISKIPVESPGQITYTITITSYIAGNYILTCGVKFTLTGVSVSDQNDVSYDSNVDVHVTFAGTEQTTTVTPDPDTYSCSPFCDWQIALMVVIPVAVLTIILVIICCCCGEKIRPKWIDCCVCCEKKSVAGHAMIVFISWFTCERCGKKSSQADSEAGGGSANSKRSKGAQDHQLEEIKASGSQEDGDSSQSRNM